MKSGRKAAGNPAEQSEIGRNTLKMLSKRYLDLFPEPRRLIFFFFFLRTDTVKIPGFPEFLYKK